MIQRMRPLAELSARARRILFEQLGVVDALRFLGQFDTGYGNYATDRDAWQAGLTVEQIAADIGQWKQSRNTQDKP